MISCMVNILDSLMSNVTDMVSYCFVDGVSREMFNKWQAQRWWAENYDKVMELYNVQKFNQQAVPLPTPPRSEDEVHLFGLLVILPCSPYSWKYVF